MLDHVSLGVSDIERSRNFYDAELRQRKTPNTRAQSPAAGNGIFGCRDRAPKQSPNCANTWRDQNPRDEWPKIPAETPYLASHRKRAAHQGSNLGPAD